MTTSGHSVKTLKDEVDFGDKGGTGDDGSFSIDGLVVESGGEVVAVGVLFDEGTAGFTAGDAAAEAPPTSGFEVGA